MRRGGWRSWTILWPDGAVYGEADRFLQKHDGSGTQRTYAYLLVDHLRWLEREALDLGSVQLRDLERYMGLVGAQVNGPLGVPWRIGKRPYGHETLKTAAACLKGFYLDLAVLGSNAELGRQLALTRLPSRADRNRALLGHVKRSAPANPLAPKVRRRRHPKLLPDGARDALLANATTARDRMVVTWLLDGGFRIGELCGLHLADLHLRERAACAQARVPHTHICHRRGNRNQASAKTKYPWALEDGVITGGLIKRVSPAMIHTYFDYMTSEYPTAADHGMLLVQLTGLGRGDPWTADAARGMFARMSRRAGLGHITPHQCRHQFATNVLDAADGNLLIARDAGGWASTATVADIYAHIDIHDPALTAALQTVWGER